MYIPIVWKQWLLPTMPDQWVYPITSSGDVPGFDLILWCEYTYYAATIYGVLQKLTCPCVVSAQFFSMARLCHILTECMEIHLSPSQVSIYKWKGIQL